MIGERPVPRITIRDESGKLEARSGRARAFLSGIMGQVAAALCGAGALSSFYCSVGLGVSGASPDLPCK